MTFEALMKELKSGKIKPVYLLHGEEDFYIDKACRFFEKELLSESERDFGLHVFYGKDAEWSDVVNACRQYPMFIQKQVVILKEAQTMKKADLELLLEQYLSELMDTTIFVITYKHGKMDGRSKSVKFIAKHGSVFLGNKIYENQLHGWIQSYVQSAGYTITQNACMMMATHIGLDLSIQSNELNKMFINLPAGSMIDDKAVENFVGISREYNVFEFQKALGTKDVPKLTRIIQYFEGNPKAAHLAFLLPILYNFFSKVEIVLQLKGKSQSEIANNLGVSPFFAKDYIQGAKAYGSRGVEHSLLLLHEYNLRMLGVNDVGTDQTGLLKELVGKILYD